MKRLDINSLHETFLCFKKDNRCKKGQQKDRDLSCNSCLTRCFCVCDMNNRNAIVRRSSQDRVTVVTSYRSSLLQPQPYDFLHFLCNKPHSLSLFL